MTRFMPKRNPIALPSIEQMRAEGFLVVVFQVGHQYVMSGNSQIYVDPDSKSTLDIVAQIATKQEGVHADCPSVFFCQKCPQAILDILTKKYQIPSGSIQTIVRC